jgi:hypothetical protein
MRTIQTSGALEGPSPVHAGSRGRRRAIIAGAAVGVVCLVAPLTGGVADRAEAAPPSPAVSAVEPTKARTIVTTDPELDDLNSLLRMLLYSNEIEIDGLVYSSSQHHFSGDPEQGIAPFRWPDPTDRFHIDTAVDQYEKVYPNLTLHADGYPTPDELRSVIRWGNVTTKGDVTDETPGSELIKDALLDDVPGKLYLEAWGGPNTIARALMSIQEEFEGTPEWDAIHAKVSEKAILTSFGQQDDTFSTYIRPNWPELEQREVATSIWGYFARSVVPAGQEGYLGAEWTRENVSSVGPMGETYRVWGDGEHMAAGFDNEDYFGLSGYTAAELRAMGYLVWMPPQEEGSWISEGDSSNFAMLIQNGLRNYENPTYGGWGGRQAVNPDDPYQWRNAGVLDVAPDGTTPADYPAARWFEDFQLDFAARLQWSVTPEYGRANHEPAVTVPTGLDPVSTAGDTLEIRADVSDPDGDDVTTRWWNYQEAGTGAGALSFSAPDSAVTGVTVPADAEAGDTFHAIIEVRDSGTPAMTSYQRVIITVVDEYQPVIDAVSSPTASTTGSTSITVTGSQLADVEAVTVGGTPATDVTVAADGRSVTFTAPASETAGTAVISLSSRGEAATSKVDYVSPTVTSVTPARGPSTGGSRVSITGTDLALTQAVVVGGGRATNVVAAPGNVDLTTVAGATGSADIVVELPGADVVIDDGFHYATVAIEIGSNTARAGGDVTYTITGLGVGERAQLWLDADSLLLGDVTAGEDGTVCAQVRIPNDAAVGDHTLVARAQLSGSDTADLRVTAATSATAGGSRHDRLAATGADTSAALGAALVALLAGAALLAARRIGSRRRSV